MKALIAGFARTCPRHVRNFSMPYALLKDEKIMKCFHVAIMAICVLLANALSASDAAANTHSRRVCKITCSQGFQRCVKADHSVGHVNFCHDEKWTCMGICLQTQCEPGEMCQ